MKRFQHYLMVLVLALALCRTAQIASAQELERSLNLSSLLGNSDVLDALSGAAGSGELGGLGSLLELFGQVTGRTMKDCTITKIPDQTYTGKAIRPVPTVTCKGEKLTRGTDFSLSYTDNTKVGTAKCIITGKGLYSGKRTVSFRIVKGSASSGKSSVSSSKKNSTAAVKKLTVKLSQTSYTYNGNAQ